MATTRSGPNHKYIRYTDLEHMDELYNLENDPFDHPPGATRFASMEDKVATLKIIVGLVALTFVPLQQRLEALYQGEQLDPSETTWTSHEELESWLYFPQELRAHERLTENRRHFLRVRRSAFESFHQFPLIAPGVAVGTEPQDAPSVLDPKKHNAVRVTLRQNFGFPFMRGFWFHRNGEYDESFETTPRFEDQPLEAGDDWQTLTFSLLDSPHLDLENDVVSIILGELGPRFWGGTEDLEAAFEAAPSDAYFDLERIEVIRLDVAPSVAASIESFEPQRGFRGTEVSIHGTGFAVPATRNAVFFGPNEATILSGDATTLVVEASASSGEATVVVRVPGGLHASSTERYEVLPNPSIILVESGDRQVAPVSTTLSPFRVRLASRGREPVPDQRLVFTVVSGDASLSNTEVVTDDDGFAQTRVKLGEIPGPVLIEVSWSNALRAELHATATP